MKIGVVSDTHGFFDPKLQKLFDGVEAILHGGDVGSRSVLDELGQTAKVYAVRGNVDSPELNLPPSLTLRLDGVQVEMQHILPVSQAQLEEFSASATGSKIQSGKREAFLRGFNEATRVVIFGHSHQPCLVTLGKKLFFNPGSAGKHRFSLPRCCGLLETFSDGIEATIKLLGRYNGELPEKLWLDFEE